MRESRKGRPLKPAAMRKRRNNTFRTRDALYERLKASAEANERSITEEVEYRLEQSFLLQDVRETIREEMRGASKPYDASVYASALSNLGRNEAAFTYHRPVIGKQPDCQ
jgi:hypothetical protein